jgi:hypothetical protein
MSGLLFDTEVAKKNFLYLPAGVEVSPNKLGLFIEARLDYNQWFALVSSLQVTHRCLLWLIGDALCWGENAFGEDFSQAISEYSKQVQYNAMWVSRQIPISRRREVSWSHHFEVAGLEPKQQDKFLQAALDNRWSTRELRAAVQNKAPANGDGVFAEPAADPLAEFDVKEVIRRVIEFLEHEGAKEASPDEILQITGAIRQHFARN